MTRPTIIEVSDIILIADDVDRALASLPEDLRRDIAPLLRRMGEWRLATIQGEVARPTTLLVAFSRFLELLGDEYSAR
ncbi:MAG: hypothetical protein KF889_23895 [Alphaproteobacteria bacterium]|nr:hypothetical protein [Alphaproteobacteria bacterium]MCW5742788.1 hypothetical protein [Alphaproteobacteria bacterium]